MSKPKWLEAPSIEEVFNKLNDDPDDLATLILAGDTEAGSVAEKLAAVERKRTLEERRKRGLFGTNETKSLDTVIAGRTQSLRIASREGAKTGTKRSPKHPHIKSKRSNR